MFLKTHFLRPFNSFFVRNYLPFLRYLSFLTLPNIFLLVLRLYFSQVEVASLTVQFHHELMKIPLLRYDPITKHVEQRQGYFTANLFLQEVYWFYHSNYRFPLRTWFLVYHTLPTNLFWIIVFFYSYFKYFS